MRTARTAMRRLRGEAHAFLELVAVPGLAALLPWPLCFRLFRWIARHSKLYEAKCALALRHATALGVVDDPASWLMRRRLTTLVDHADFYLERTRSNAWLRRYVIVDGQWPSPDEPAIFCTFHWGAGMWGLRHAAAHGLKAHALAATPTRQHFTGQTVWYLYIRARVASVMRVLGRPTLDPSADLRPMLRALRKCEQAMAVVDVPADQSIANHPVTLQGLRTEVPKALFRLAVQQQVPVSTYITGFDPGTGRRTLRIRQLGRYDDQAALIRDVYAELDQAMGSDTAAWHFWSEAERFFRA